MFIDYCYNGIVNIRYSYLVGSYYTTSEENLMNENMSMSTIPCATPLPVFRSLNG